MNALIIDDDRQHVEHTIANLRAHGYRVVAARAGIPGLDLARVVLPDVIILDWILPDLDGFEICRRLRSDERTASTPIVMVSSLDDSMYRRRGFRVGANAYLNKPYRPAELLEAVKAARLWRTNLAKSKVRHEVTIELDSETPFLLEVNDFLDELCRLTPLDERQVMHLRQAFLEIGQNAIEWGHSQHTDQLVLVTFRAYEDRVEIVVRDEGPGFDPENLPHAATPDDPTAHIDLREELGLREGGFGLLIARGLVDELRHAGRGNVVTMIKRFKSDADLASSGSDE
jgi:DNA-binding response OmpR family regulator